MVSSSDIFHTNIRRGVYSQALPATVQVDLGERDSFIIVFMALLIDDKDVLSVFYRAAVQRCDAGVAARSGPYLDSFVLP